MKMCQMYLHHVIVTNYEFCGRNYIFHKHVRSIIQVLAVYSQRGQLCLEDQHLQDVQ